VDDGIFLLRIPKFLHQGKHAVKVELCLGKFGDMFEAIIYEGVEVIQGLVVLGFNVRHVRDCNRRKGAKQEV
jgi:hypothetical protein